MKRFIEKAIYTEKGKGKITFVTDNKFGDNHYIVYNHENNVLGYIPLGMLNGKKLTDVLNLYCNGGSLA